MARDRLSCGDNAPPLQTSRRTLTNSNGPRRRRKKPKPARSLRTGLANKNVGKNEILNTTRRGREPGGSTARPAHRAGDGKRAMIKITHTVTSDSPDGQPWPPPDSGALWVIVRRADGCTLWRAIHLVMSRYRVIAATAENTKAHPVVDRMHRRVVRAAGILGPPTPLDSIHRDLGACPNAAGRLAGHDMHRRSSS